MKFNFLSIESALISVELGNPALNVLLLNGVAAARPGALGLNGGPSCRPRPGQGERSSGEADPQGEGKGRPGPEITELSEGKGA